MGVLDARANAEKITYPVIGEETKEASNVIDYNINEEITTNTSAVSNANNDTTTGMATVIPGVNAPKLIQTTSIYQNGEGYTGGITASGSIRLTAPSDPTGNIWSWTLSDKYGNIPFYNKTNAGYWDGFVIPVAGWYQIDMTCPHGGSTFSVDVQLRITRGGYGNWITIIDHIGQYNNQTPVETIRYNFTAGDTLYARVNVNYSGSSLTGTHYVSLKVTKL